MNKNAVKQGVSPQDASYFVGKSFLSMVQDAELDCDNPRRFDDLIDEQTPGGLNEQVSARLFKVEMIYPINCVFHKGPPSYSIALAELNPSSRHWEILINLECLTPTIEPWMQRCLG